MPPFKWGIGGVIGSGEQMMSWIDMEDVVRAIQFCLLKNEMHGPINIVSPSPVTNREFTTRLGKILNRPTLVPLPAFMARLIFADMADEMLLSGPSVIPEKLQKAGFTFNYPDLQSSLVHLLG